MCITRETKNPRKSNLLFRLATIIVALLIIMYIGYVPYLHSLIDGCCCKHTWGCNVTFTSVVWWNKSQQMQTRKKRKKKTKQNKQEDKEMAVQIISVDLFHNFFEEILTNTNLNASLLQVCYFVSSLDKNEYVKRWCLPGTEELKEIWDTVSSCAENDRRGLSVILTSITTTSPFSNDEYRCSGQNGSHACKMNK